MRFVKKPLIDTLNNHLIDYPTPTNLSYFWSYGFLAGMCLISQIVTGVLLAMNYVPHVEYAFDSVERIMRDVPGG
jgi:ubiquinol-cytochrome c reductase cytochrome b subunit